MKRALAAVGFLIGSVWATHGLRSELGIVLMDSSGGSFATPTHTPPLVTVEVIPAPLWAVILAGLLVAGLVYVVAERIEERQRMNHIRRGEPNGA